MVIFLNRKWAKIGFLMPILIVFSLFTKPSLATRADQLSTVEEVVGLRIDAININIPLLTTTLDEQRHLIVPDNPNQAAWYSKGPKAGNAGSALITGHLDSMAGPGVFFNLKNINTGDRVQVKRDDGKIASFKVDKLESYPQDDSFPWKEIYSTSGPSSLRIITCDGEYNPNTGSYSRNLVVYASLIDLK
jgi:LPXTG-site transpeptidase (sortase) family protein